ncbi:ferrous iron transport protein B [Acetobacter tropicalis]|uniref:Ferrous iron transport protein B n=1 Tax=Acetobacter tropicalis TaxID=104102 RepID=A0A094ZTL2_9PROT|nr:ferrous iron transport protein B [Acetobacter tropicalis]KAA8389951.1 ferrous iron transport protein B [Acetobacter tropicalis]KAA8393004.1 ferrous iron transport protein B [Acetobacter tropicalis]KGB25456.1 Ferrous iron transport protein B [Acetobacter tropicalis]MBC9008055.1 ferrous iron transport protein B [Acetobacter tropicalis]MDO8172669.1 ferrous iron transport protein B [Acetobacter tropicalis]
MTDLSPLRVALVGNPNCGKTAIFNQLTGSRQKVANYAGVTVERKAGRLVTPAGRRVQVLDLPGTYSLAATSPDEAVTRDVCRGIYKGEPAPDLLVSVVAATNLRLHLRFMLELRQLGRPMIVVLNMIDAISKQGLTIDIPRLQAELGVPVVTAVGIKRGGGQNILAALDAPPPPPPTPLPEGTDLHAEVRRLLALCVARTSERKQLFEDKLDRWVLHPVWGMLILFVLLFIMFQAVFSWAQPFMDMLDNGMKSLGDHVGALLPDGVLRSLVVDGIIAGAGTVIVFLPQILILFLWILALEESGYLPRAAFMLDKLMASAGLSGRSFIPLLSSFACAVPGIMSTRTIQNPRDRMVTIMIAPLMTCSARLPVYALLIGAFIPARHIAGLFNLQGLVLFGLYAAGILSALVVARVLKRRATTDEHPLLLELPNYRLPGLQSLSIELWQRARIFLSRVGTIIVTLSVLMWALSSFPAPPAGATGPAIDYSLAGRIGHLMLPFFQFIGFNWQICVALIPGLAAREVAVSALATVYSVGASEADAASQLAPLLSAQWSLATAFSLLAWYVYAPQCFSTLAVIRRETGSWRLVWISTAYLFGMAYAASFLAYHITRLISG